MKEIILIIATVILIIATPVVYYSVLSETTTEQEIKIVSAERVCSADSCQYLVFTEDEVFANHDSLLFWKWNSSDFHSELIKNTDKSCNVSVYGWRIPFFSAYRNIYKINEYN